MDTPSYLTDPSALREQPDPSAQTAAPPGIQQDQDAGMVGQPISMRSRPIDAPYGSRSVGGVLVPNPDPWGSVKAFGYSAANSALLGVPDMIVKAISQPAYADLKKLRSENAAASMAGDVAGMFVPGLGELGLAGKAVEGVGMAARAAKLGKTAGAIDKLLEVAKGGEGASKLAQGLAGGFVQAAPRALTTGLTTGDPMQAGTELLAGTVGGGALGAVAGRFAKSAPQILQEGAEAADKALVNGAIGINSTKAFKKMLGTSATDPMIMDAYKSTADLIRGVAKDNEGLTMIKPVLKDLVSDTGKTWEAFAQNFDAASPKIGTPEGLAQLTQNPIVKEFTSTFGAEGQSALQKLVGQVDNSPSFASKRSLLDTYANAGFKSDDPMKQYLGSTAKAIKSQIDEAAMALTPDADLGEMKQIYKALLPIKKMLQQEAFKGENLFAQGSQTFVRGATKAAMDSAAGKGPGALLMGMVNPAIGAAQIGGDIIGKVAPQMANKAGAKIGQYLGPALRSPAAQKAAEGLAGSAGDITQGAAKVAAGLAQAVPDSVDLPAESAPAKVPNQDELAVMGNVPGAARTVSLENNAPIGAASAAKQEINQRYAGVIQQRLSDQYNKYYRNYMPFDQFAQQVAQVTNNFDPKFSARFLFDDAGDQSNFLKAYNASLQKKTIDLNGALEHASATTGVLPAAEAIKGLFRDPKTMRNQKSYSDLLDLLETTSGKPRKDIDNTISQIARQRAPVLMKKQMLNNALRYNFGYNVDMLENLGLEG